MAIQREIIVYECEKCGKQYPTAYLADICCKEYKCERCGKVCEKYSLICNDCHEKDIYDKAEKLTMDQYKEKYKNYLLYDPKTMTYFDTDMQEITSFYELRNLELPKYLYGTEPYKVEIDIETAIEWAESESNLEDFYFENTRELIDFVKEWNEKNGVTAYMANDKTIVEFTEKEIKKYWECDTNESD